MVIREYIDGVELATYQYEPATGRGGDSARKEEPTLVQDLERIWTKGQDTGESVPPTERKSKIATML